MQMKISYSKSFMRGRWIKHLYKVSHKIEYTPHVSAVNLVYIFKGQYYRNETWEYFRVVNVQLV